MMMMMMIIDNLPVFIFLVLLIFPQTCFCKKPHICTPFSCGNIHNISYPFRLKHDSKDCGHPDYELECENNATAVLYLNPQKFRVKEINYNSSTIWLADVSVKNNTCSFPNVTHNRDYPNFYRMNDDTTISLMRCPYELKNSSLFTELPAHCVPSNSSTHIYINVGNMKASDIGDNCSVELIVQTLCKFKDLKNVSISEIHDSLLYGFQLKWGTPCRWCNGRERCPIYDKHGVMEEIVCRHGVGAWLEALWDHIEHPKYRYKLYDGSYIPIVFNGAMDQYLRPYDPSSALVLILLLVLVVVLAGVSIPAKIILGFTSAFRFITVQMNQDRQSLNTNWPVEHLPLIIGLFFAVRFIIVFSCIVWFFIYKFQRRHLSRFSAIEEYLQSENNLMPIRYSYSEIKKMTRGFREKLGQGGYGTVYKGKLRSGYDVAVKILGKPGGNGQDFMNEISTIGRIHHVNVVKLVGYCAEGSKRALVFDYMPNGSLDKYLYSREKTSSCLSWERKYEIVIGVARGIEYLHRGCDIQILHFDIKPHNILLDDNFTPKITDFGLAKFFSTDKKVVTMTAVRGTVGYVAPELINRGFGEVSYKADVYSFGMLLMEMVGLNKDLKRNNQASSQYFPDWIYDSFEQGHDIEIGVTDENNDDNNNDANREIAKKMTIVALWCIQMSPGDRPSMNKVVQMLEAKVECLQVPNRQFGAARVAINDEGQSWSTYSTDSTSLLPNNAVPSTEITVVD